MPGGVFDVIAVDRLMTFKLIDPFLILPKIVECEAALPMMRAASRLVGDLLIPIRNRSFEIAGKEFLHSLLVELGREGQREGYENEEPQGIENRHEEWTTLRYRLHFRIIFESRLDALLAFL